MSNHESFCTALKMAVKVYSMADLKEGIEQTKGRPDYEDYLKIYQDEIDERNSQKITDI